MTIEAEGKSREDRGAEMLSACAGRYEICKLFPRVCSSTEDE